MNNRPIIIATRGSALALAQANNVLGLCRAAFPERAFEIKIIKTTGDKLQTASMANPNSSLPKGLFTKELEVALLNQQADLAVHSLKDLPTELPAGLKLGAVGPRADVRDVLVYRDADWVQKQKSEGPPQEWVVGQPQQRGCPPKTHLKDLPPGFVVATSSVRRKAQILAKRPDLNVVEIRGNVATRLQKLHDQADIDATILAAAGLERLHFTIAASGHLHGENIPEGLCATRLDIREMLPAVGQGAVGIEIREGDERMEAICARLNHEPTWVAVTAERAFLMAMGGGCQTPTAAHAHVSGATVHMEALNTIGSAAHRAEARRPLAEAVELGQFLAAELSGR
ncbi:MAG: hydroxymethylbilane synthase [Verrucomicrobiota bacterium]